MLKNFTLQNVVESITILNPAKLLGLDRELGSIAPGKKANLLLIDDLVHVKKVFLAGREVSEP